MDRNAMLESSDWVMGKTKHGELVQGFVETVDSTRGIARVYVVKCDNEEAIGKLVTIPLPWLERMSTGTVAAPQQLHDLIELALATRDKEWFMELTAKMLRNPHAASESQDRKRRSDFPRNRLGTSAIGEP
ncbi:IDEAL domain-containing protein [Brevibacillus sp. SAFN-007a]|uniref:IDEAL domain-containing protein n=1 Tax=Brevibacillus sp. SAFN-007a TaxID=3436862 RepID=UPI003F800F93